MNLNPFLLRPDSDEAPYNPDGEDIYNYDMFFETEYIYFLIPTYALLLFGFTLVFSKAEEWPIVQSINMAPPS